MTQTLNEALKEWQVAVTALAQGETILLLRKGGIREERGRFTVPHRQVLLYPTYEHQKPSLLKPAYAEQVEPVAPGWHPETVPIRAWADITQVLTISSEAALAGLLPFHIWNATFAAERFQWKPNQPLSLLLLRVFRLPQVRPIPYQTEYGGCRSWLTLQESVAISDSTPVLSDAAYRGLETQICQSVRTTAPPIALD